jgi:hypothetical protein
MFKVFFESGGVITYSTFGKNNYSIGVKEGAGGTTYGPFVFIRGKYINDTGLRKHELVHVRQGWNPRWWFKSRIEKERAAYKEQIKWYPERTYDENVSYFAKRIAESCNLGVTQKEAEILLRA